MKNWYNYKDVQDVVVQPKDPYEGTDQKSLAAKYVEDVTDSLPNDQE